MPGPDPKPYVLFPGTAREALQHYREVFGGELELHTYADFGRSDGPADAIAHATLRGPVFLHAADAGPDEDGFSSTGLFFALLGTAAPEVLRAWFDALADGGRALDPLAERGWGAWDGQVRDRFGLTWLIGWESEPEVATAD
jgi:PhnB protein